MRDNRVVNDISRVLVLGTLLVQARYLFEGISFRGCNHSMSAHAGTHWIADRMTQVTACISETDACE